MFERTILKYFLPPRFALYGHVISDMDLIMANRYRYPNYKELGDFIEFSKKAGYEFVGYHDYLKVDSKKKILLTFDDGYKEIYSEINPYLMSKKIPYMIFICTDTLENEKFLSPSMLKYREEGRRYYMNKDEILQLKAQGVAVGFHTRSHFRIEARTDLNNIEFLTQISIDEKLKDLFSDPLAFAYPYYAPKEYLKFDRVLEERGFKNIFDAKGLHADSGNHYFRVSMDSYGTDMKCKNPIMLNLEKSTLKRCLGLLSR